MIERPAAARSGGGVFGALVASAGSLIGSVSPLHSTLGAAPHRAGFTLDRYVLPEMNARTLQHTRQLLAESEAASASVMTTMSAEASAEALTPLIPPPGHEFPMLKQRAASTSGSASLSLAPGRGSGRRSMASSAQSGDRYCSYSDGRSTPELDGSLRLLASAPGSQCTLANPDGGSLKKTEPDGLSLSLSLTKPNSASPHYYGASLPSAASSSHTLLPSGRSSDLGSAAWIDKPGAGPATAATAAEATTTSRLSPTSASRHATHNSSSSSSKNDPFASPKAAIAPLVGSGLAQDGWANDYIGQPLPGSRAPVPGSSVAFGSELTGSREDELDARRAWRKKVKKRRHMMRRERIYVRLSPPLNRYSSYSWPE